MGRCANYYDYYIIKMILMVWGVELYVNGFCHELFVQRSEFNSS